MIGHLEIAFEKVKDMNDLSRAIYMKHFIEEGFINGTISSIDYLVLTSMFESFISDRELEDYDVFIDVTRK